MHMHPDKYPRQQTNMKMVTILAIAILVLAGALFVLFPNLAWATEELPATRRDVSKHGDTASPK